MVFGPWAKFSHSFGEKFRLVCKNCILLVKRQFFRDIFSSNYWLVSWIFLHFESKVFRFLAKKIQIFGKKLLAFLSKLHYMCSKDCLMNSVVSCHNWVFQWKNSGLREKKLTFGNLVKCCRACFLRIQLKFLVHIFLKKIFKV